MLSQCSMLLYNQSPLSKTFTLKYFIFGHFLTAMLNLFCVFFCEMFQNVRKLVAFVLFSHLYNESEWLSRMTASVIIFLVVEQCKWIERTIHLMITLNILNTAQQVCSNHSVSIIWHFMTKFYLMHWIYNYIESLVSARFYQGCIKLTFLMSQDFRFK